MDFQEHEHKIYTAILFLPALGFFGSNQTVMEYAHFLLIIALVAASYYFHTRTFESKTLNQVRKCFACLSTALLILFLSAEVSDILLSVYKVGYGEELTFLLKMILMVSNMEGNLDLCIDKKENDKQSSSSNVI